MQVPKLTVNQFYSEKASIAMAHAIVSISLSLLMQKKVFMTCNIFVDFRPDLDEWDPSHLQIVLQSLVDFRHVAFPTFHYFLFASDTSKRLYTHQWFVAVMGFMLVT